MGQSLNIACKTCKKDYYLGYGGGKYLERCKLKFPFEQHSGHELVEIGEQVELAGSDLYISHLWKEDEPFIVGYKDYEHIDLENETPIFLRTDQQCDQ